MTVEKWWDKTPSKEKEKIMKMSSPKKIILSDYDIADDGYGLPTYRCPTCNKLLDTIFSYCPYCGQRLTWRLK